MRDESEAYHVQISSLSVGDILPDPSPCRTGQWTAAHGPARCLRHRPAAPPAPPAESDAPETIAAVPQPPTDTLRILPIPTVQPTSLTPEPAFIDVNTPTVTLRIITADAANVRDAASRTGTVIGRLENGEIVQVLGTSGDWVHVRLEGDGIDGFVHRRLISTEPPGLTASTLFPAVD